jgi:PHP family Zn ribbon phosphoesterase
VTLRMLKADLHIHTCLSPCADLAMGPRAIVDKAAQHGLDVIGICDHNSSENVPAVVKAARDANLKVMPGMEVTSKEEVHILALFDSIHRALELQEIVYEHLPGENNAEAFGPQAVVNEDHEVLGFNTRLLAGATELSVEEVVNSIHGLDGLAFAAHVDRETFGIIGQLGFIPQELRLDALEVSRNTSLEEARRRFQQYSHFAFVRSSDAHFVEDIGTTFTSFLLNEATTVEIRKALRGEDGRRVVLGDSSVCSPLSEKQVFG